MVAIQMPAALVEVVRNSLRASIANALEDGDRRLRSDIREACTRLDIAMELHERVVPSCENCGQPMERCSSGDPGCFHCDDCAVARYERPPSVDVSKADAIDVSTKLGIRCPRVSCEGSINAAGICSECGLDIITGAP